MKYRPHETRRYRAYRDNMRARGKKPMPIEQWVKEYRKATGQEHNSTASSYGRTPKSKSGKPRKRKVKDNGNTERSEVTDENSSGATE